MRIAHPPMNYVFDFWGVRREETTVWGGGEGDGEGETTEMGGVGRRE